MLPLTEVEKELAGPVLKDGRCLVRAQLGGLDVSVVCLVYEVEGGDIGMYPGAMLVGNSALAWLLERVPDAEVLPSQDEHMYWVQVTDTVFDLLTPPEGADTL